MGKVKEGDRSREVAGGGGSSQVGQKIKIPGNSWGKGQPDQWEQFSHWPFLAGGCVLGNGHGNPHLPFVVPEGLSPLPLLAYHGKSGFLYSPTDSHLPGPEASPSMGTHLTSWSPLLHGHISSRSAALGLTLCWHTVGAENTGWGITGVLTS